jgi:hypothetical protein
MGRGEGKWLLRAQEDVRGLARDSVTKLGDVQTAEGMLGKRLGDKGELGEVWDGERG